MLEGIQQDTLPIGNIPALQIRPDDILDIQVSSRLPETVSAFNINHPDESTGRAGEQAYGTLKGYRVDEEGNIYLPFLGKVEATGKTIVDLRKEISEKLSMFIPDASVQIRFLNFRVTVLGEVTRPNTYIIPNEKLTVLEAIGMAGDFTPYAMRDNVLVIREREDEREMGRINVRDSDVFTSPYFYLSPNDIIYIQPLKAKKFATQGDFLQRYAILIVPVVSFGTFLLGTIIVSNN